MTNRGIAYRAHAVAASVSLAFITVGPIAIAQSTNSNIDPVTGQPMAALPSRAAPSPAPADTQPSPAPSRTVALATEPRWSHRHQLTIRAAGSEGYRLAIRYQNGIGCNNSGETFCHDRSPVMLDAALGFGVSDDVELEARFRVGEFGWNGAIPLAAGIGIRAYGGDQSRLKLVFGAAVFADFTGANGVSGWGTDIIARVEEGLHYDVARYFAFYFQLGESFGLLRSFTFIADAGLGVQARLP